MSDLAGKTIAVQATGKPEAIFLSGGENVPAFRNVISLADRGVQYAAGLRLCGRSSRRGELSGSMKDYGELPHSG